jgi:hypothetical protein
VNEGFVNKAKNLTIIITTKTIILWCGEEERLLHHDVTVKFGCLG